MGDFDDPRLLAAMRAYVAAADAIAKAAALDDDRATMDRGDERVIAAMSLRRRLTIPTS